MNDLTEKAAYLKGLADGMELDERKDETRLLRQMTELLCDMAHELGSAGASIEETRSDIEELSSRVDEIDEDLSLLEDDYYEDYEELPDGDEEDIYEITCPSCGKHFYFPESGLDSDEPIACPACGFEIDEIEITEDSQDADGTDDITNN